MTIDQMIEHCRTQQELTISANPQVAFHLPGKWGKRNTRRLFRSVPHGVPNPQGKIRADFHGMILVAFSAQEVLDACHALKALDWREGNDD